MQSLGESLDVYAPAKRRLQTLLCECGGRSVYGVSTDPDDKKVYMLGMCEKHVDWDLVEAGGKYSKPLRHPSTPARFLSTDPLRLHPSMQQALVWNPVVGKPGLLMHGTSGIGKTRTAWHITNRMWLSGLEKGYNMRVDFLPMRLFEERVIEAFEERRHSAALKEIMGSDFLVLDDLGKERLTSRMATDLFSVIDHRTEHDLPTVITTNYSGKPFLERFAPHDRETGIAIGRRIRDYFTIQGMSHENQE